MTACTGGCGRELSPNDIRLGYRLCKECERATPTDSPEQIAEALVEFNNIGHQLYRDGGISDKTKQRVLVERRKKLRQYLAAQGIMTNAQQN